MATKMVTFNKNMLQTTN